VEQEVPVRLRRSLLIAALLGSVLAVPASAQPPSNDTFENATVISSLPFSDTLDTTEATSDSVDAEVVAACGVSVTTAKSVWYEYTPPVDQAVAIDTSGSNYSVGVGVVTGSPGSFAAQSCFAGSGSFFATAGVTYHFGIADIGVGTGGTLQLSVTAPPPATVDIEVDRFGHVNPHTHVATVTGTATCTEAPSGQVSVNLTQTKGQETAQGFGFAEFLCDGAPHAWSAVISTFAGQFQGGPADVVADGFACNVIGCASDHVERGIVLRAGPPAP
jgi:uncharacterized protein DUF6299